jgi:hypothetical protein
MKIKSEDLILELVETTKQNVNLAVTLKTKSSFELNWKENQTAWSILECLEHLNRYGHFYIPEIDKAINESKNKSELVFKSGFLGDYFAKSMLPKANLNKMKTFKDKNPLNSNLDRNTIDRFINQQIKILDLLDKAKKISLNKVKTNISVTKLIKLRIGDTFRIVIYHNIRHLKQIETIIKLETDSR